MAVPKKRTSMSKKRIRKNLWKKKGHLAAERALSLRKAMLKKKSNTKEIYLSANFPLKEHEYDPEYDLWKPQSVLELLTKPKGFSVRQTRKKK